ncbi:MAG: hypothetical protein ABEJ67_02295 [Halanaeroarchaeum sp.]
MSLKRLVKTALALSALAVAGLTAYHYYVEEQTATEAAFKALEEYNGALTTMASFLSPVVERAFTAADRD